MTDKPLLQLQRQRPHYLTQHYRCLQSLRNLVFNDFRNLPRSHHCCERHIHHRNQQHLQCFTPTHCPHRSHWHCLWSSICLPPRWWISGASDMREAASGIALVCITVTECHWQRRWKVYGGLSEQQTMGSLHHNSFCYVLREHNNQPLMFCWIRRGVVFILRVERTKWSNKTIPLTNIYCGRLLTVHVLAAPSRENIR